MKNRQETIYNTLVAKEDDRYYVLDYTFQANDNFKGSVWTVFEAISHDEYNDRLHCDGYFEEVWKLDVCNGNTRLGLSDFIDSLSSYDIENVLFDTSYEGREQYEEVMKVAQFETGNIKRLDCVGGGRSLSKDSTFDVIYNVALLNEAMKFEE